MPPYPDSLILPSTPYPRPIRTPIHRKNLIQMSREILPQLSTRHIPHLERCVLTAAHQQPAIRTETRHVNRPNMTFERVDKLPIARVPQLNMVIEGRARNKEPVGRERDVIDLFLVPEQPREGLDTDARRPQIHREVVAGGDEALEDLAVDRSRFLEAVLGFGDLGFGRGGDVAGVVVVGGAEHKVRAERQVVHPVRVRGEVVCQGAGGRVPDFDGFVARRGVDETGAAPAHAGDGVFVPCEGEVDARGSGVPDADGGVFGG